MSATNNINAAITLLLNITAQAGRVSAAIASARAEARDLSNQELTELQADDDAARAQLVGAIAAAKSAS